MAPLLSVTCPLRPNDGRLKTVMELVEKGLPDGRQHKVVPHQRYQKHSVDVLGESALCDITKDFSHFWGNIGSEGFFFLVMNRELVLIMKELVTSFCLKITSGL